eukprot:9092886-Alexandrium_andersonii.AAC.1
MSAALQLGLVELRCELQVGPRGRRAPGDLLLAQPRAAHVDVHSAHASRRMADCRSAGTVGGGRRV